MTRSISLTSALLAATALSACSDPEPRVIIIQPVPGQLDIVKEEIRSNAAARNRMAENSVESYNKRSLDGNGRIYYDESSNTMTIYANPPRAAKIHVHDGVHLDHDAQTVFRQAAGNYYSRSEQDIPQPMSDDVLRDKVKNVLHNASRAFFDEVIQDQANRSVVNFTAGRICTYSAHQKSGDCFNINSLDKATPLYKDISLGIPLSAKKNPAP